MKNICSLHGCWIQRNVRRAVEGPRTKAAMVADALTQKANEKWRRPLPRVRNGLSVCHWRQLRSSEDDGRKMHTLEEVAIGSRNSTCLGIFYCCHAVEHCRLVQKDNWQLLLCECLVRFCLGSSSTCHFVFDVWFFVFKYVLEYNYCLNFLVKKRNRHASC